MITMTAKIDILQGDNSVFSSVSCNVSNIFNSSDIGRILGVKSVGTPYIGSTVSNDEGKFGYTERRSTEWVFVGGFGLSRFGGVVNGKYLVLSAGQTQFFETQAGDVFETKKIVVKNGNTLVASYPKDDRALFDIDLVDLNTMETASAGAQFYFYIPKEYTETHTIDDVFELLAKSNFEITAILTRDYSFQPYKIVVETTSPLPSLVMAFDGTYFPTKITVDGKEYKNERNVFAIGNLKETTTHTIVIDDLNAERRPLTIYGIYTGFTIDVNARNLVSVGSKTTDRGDLKLPSFGIISNTGSLELNDALDEILYFAENGLLDKGQPCKIFLNDTLSGKTEQIADLETEQWNYENEGKSVSVTLQDDLEEWQNINVAGEDYDPRKPEAKPLEWLYRYLWGITTTNYKMLSFEELDEGTTTVLQNTYIRYPLLESGTLWQQWTKLCQVGQCHIYKHRNGVIGCHYNGGN